MEHQRFVHLRLQLENGGVGYGEASAFGGPRWSEESVESIKIVVDRYLAPRLVGRPAGAFEANAQLMGQIAGRNFSAKAAIEAASMDAVGKSLGLPATTFLGGALRDRFPVFWALASGDPAQEIEEAQEKIARREFNRFKVKLGLSEPSDDIGRLRRIRAALGGEPMLIVDINGGWRETDCVRWFPALEELGVAIVEQPVPAAHFEAMARLAGRCPIPLMLDEAVFTKEDAARAGVLRAGAVLSLKLAKSGGLLEMKRIAAVAEAHGIELYGGCMLESSLGAAAHLCAFASLPEIPWGTEHFGPKILVEDLAEQSLRYEDFEVLLPTGPGLGVTPDLDKIKFFSSH